MTREVAAAAIVRHGRVLAARRTHPADLAGGWELPGGKLEPGESVAAAAVREVAEELGCGIEVVRRLSGRQPVKGGYHLTAHLALLVSGEPVPCEHDAIRWLGPEELDQVRWLAAERPFLGELREVLLDGTRLVGVNVGGAVRIGGTVRRATGPWTPAVHALLGHLAVAGLAEVPRVFGADERRREVMTYLPGRVLDLEVETASEVLLADAMRWLRRFHDAVSAADLAGPWRFAASDRRDTELVCHNDFAPYNVAVSTSAEGERLVGVFDWDLAGPGTSLEDLALAAWNWVPLWRPTAPSSAASRLEVMARAYGGTSAAQILDGVVPRINKMVSMMVSGSASGDPGMVNLVMLGQPERTKRSLDALELRVPDIQAALLK